MISVANWLPWCKEKNMETHQWYFLWNHLPERRENHLRPVCFGMISFNLQKCTNMFCKWANIWHKISKWWKNETTENNYFFSQASCHLHSSQRKWCSFFQTQGVNFTVDYFDLENSMNCQYDSLLVSGADSQVSITLLHLVFCCSDFCLSGCVFHLLSCPSHYTGFITVY